MFEKGFCKSANGDPMTPCAVEAKYWAETLVEKEARGCSGDTENAMRRLENRYGISWRTFWALKYRPPKDVLTEIYLRLHAAYLAECERQERLFRLEYEITKAKEGHCQIVARAAVALVGEAD